MDVHIDTKIGMMLIVAFLIGGVVGGGIGAFGGHEGRERGDHGMMRDRYEEERGEQTRTEPEKQSRDMDDMMREHMMSQSTTSTSSSMRKEVMSPSTATSGVRMGM